MKLLSLNIWGGRIGPEKLLGFFKKYNDVDVFCLQEVYAGPQDDIHDHLDRDESDRIMWHARQNIEKALSGYHSFFHSQYLENYGLQLLIKRSLDIKNSGDFFVYKHKQFVPTDSIGRRARNLQYATISVDKTQFTVINFHGLWNGQGKGDSDERIEQSAAVVEFLNTLTTPVLLAGDFNLIPDTKSMAILEQTGLQNLITHNGIISTRTSLYDKPVKFADYVLVSPSLSVSSFTVLPDEVSDHSALLLEFSIQ